MTGAYWLLGGVYTAKEKGGLLGPGTGECGGLGEMLVASVRAAGQWKNRCILGWLGIFSLPGRPQGLRFPPAEVRVAGGTCLGGGGVWARSLWCTC